MSLDIIYRFTCDNCGIIEEYWMEEPPAGWTHDSETDWTLCQNCQPHEEINDFDYWLG